MPVEKAVVVDTNVPVVANGMTSQASSRCEAACRGCLLTITRGGARLVMDDGFEIFDEYRSLLSLSGQPGVGDQFLKWVHDHQFDPERCERVVLTRSPARGYEEFPEDEDLDVFDRDDRKFVAVARASALRPAIVNAVDSDWWECREVLARHGVRVEFLCEDQLAVWQTELA